MPPCRLWLIRLQQAASRLNGEESRSLSHCSQISSIGKSRQASLSRPTATTVGRSTRWTTLSWLRSTFWPPRTECHVRQNHEWHMETLARVCQHDPQVLLATPHRLVDVTDPSTN